MALHCTIEGELATPPADPVEGEAWLVAASPSDLFAGHAAAIAGFTSSGWRFIAARTGLQVYDKSAACFRHYTDSWQRCVVPATPSGGVMIDEEVRVVLGNLLATLVSAGILATS